MTVNLILCFFTGERFSLSVESNIDTFRVHTFAYWIVFFDSRVGQWELLVWFYFDKGSSQNFPFRILSKITRNAFLVASLTPPKYTGKRKYVRDWIKVPKAQQREWLKRTSATKHLNNCRSRNLFVSLLKTVIYFWLQFRIHPIAKSRVWKSKIWLSSSDKRFFLFSSWRWLSGQ